MAESPAIARHYAARPPVAEEACADDAVATYAVEVHRPCRWLDGGRRMSGSSTHRCRSDGVNPPKLLKSLAFAVLIAAAVACTESRPSAAGVGAIGDAGDAAGEETSGDSDVVGSGGEIGAGDAESGCVSAVSTQPCDDGNVCTTIDTCKDEVCAGGPPLNCDDGDSCTTDWCDESKGCLHEDINGACDDGDGCTKGEVCSGGVCSGSGCSKNGSCDNGTCACKSGFLGDGFSCDAPVTGIAASDCTLSPAWTPGISTYALNCPLSSDETQIAVTTPLGPKLTWNGKPIESGKAGKMAPLPSCSNRKT